MPRTYKRTTGKADWSANDLKRAEEAVGKEISMRAAAKKYNIPFATFHKRLKLGKMDNPRMGRKPVFTTEQETEMASQINHLSSVFYGVNVMELRKLVFTYAKLNSIKNNFNKETQMAGNDWVTSFLRRNPTISVRKAKMTSLNRDKALNQVEVLEFYNKLEQFLDKYKFRPNNIYNADEIGVTTVADSGIVFLEKEQRIGASGECCKDITVMCSMNAAGNFIPPMFIFPRARMTPLLERDGPLGALYRNSKNGSITEDLFVEWLKHFTSYAKPTADTPVLLIIDNHPIHISLAGFNHCKENHIILLSIPPHTSHMLQPLVVAFYEPLNTAYRRECDAHMKSYMTTKIKAYDVAALFNKAYSDVASVDKGESGFRATGIYPLNSNTFTEQNYLVTSLMTEDSEDAEKVHQLPDVANTSTPYTPSQEASDAELVTPGCSHQMDVLSVNIAPTASLLPIKSSTKRKHQYDVIFPATLVETVLE